MEIEKTNVIDLYFNINPDIFSIISKLVQIFMTLLESTGEQLVQIGLVSYLVKLGGLLTENK